LRKTPSLKQDLQDTEWWEDVWGDASVDAAKETGLGIDDFPAMSPWGVADILNPNWKPE
jgi:hypothetical protein